MIAGNIPGKTQTMAVAIYDAVQSGQSQLATALVIVMSALAIVVHYAIGKAGEGRVL
jgi:molybdate transport system permease protein